MNKVFTRCLLTVCFTITLFSIAAAQTHKIDSLQIILKTLPSDTNRVKTLLALCRMYSVSNTEEMERSAQEALLLAQRIHFEKGEASSNIYIARFYNKTANAPKAIEFLLKA